MIIHIYCLSQNVRLLNFAIVTIILVAFLTETLERNMLVWFLQLNFYCFCRNLIGYFCLLTISKFFAKSQHFRQVFFYFYSCISFCLMVVQDPANLAFRLKFRPKSILVCLHPNIWWWLAWEHTNLNYYGLFTFNNQFFGSCFWSWLARMKFYLLPFFAQPSSFFVPPLSYFLIFSWNRLSFNQLFVG